jgi:hypothetical protein
VTRRRLTLPLLFSSFSFFSSRLSNMCCCTLSTPIFGQVFGLLPPFICVIGALPEYCCYASGFQNVQASRKVALTTRGIKIMTQGRGNLDNNPCDGFDQPGFPFCMRRMDQFYVEQDFEEDGFTVGNFNKTRILYYDQIRSAAVLTGDDQVYQTSVGCCFCCGGKVKAGNRQATKGLYFVRLDIGKLNGPVPDKVMKDGTLFNPVIVGLKDAQRFCAEVNARAAGGRNGSNLVRAAVVGEGQPQMNQTAVPVMGMASIVPAQAASAKGMPVVHASAPPSAVMEMMAAGGGSAAGGSIGGNLVAELEKLKALRDAGALSEEEFRAAKMVAIGGATNGSGSQKL